jgi:2-keto-4-pentenoate hydratase/2-oxohepta-3-ene-1,7-dioic acid hydratase in catechol pathway
MRIANLDDRAVILLGDEFADVATASQGRFGPDITSIWQQWEEFAEWAPRVRATSGRYEPRLLRCPVPHPRQVFAIGLNYMSHAAESAMQVPTVPATFTKFPESLAGPFDDIPLVGGANDWEVELVAVIGRRADRVSETDAWRHVAGLTVGQDISDRHLQFAASGQFSLGKSRRGYGPLGPCVVTTDEFANRDDIVLGCSLDGITMQEARTKDLIFSVPRLIAELSAVLPLVPGDLIFTGTPDGIGAVRKPPIFLQPGQVLESWVEGIGTIRNRCV